MDNSNNAILCMSTVTNAVGKNERKTHLITAVVLLVGNGKCYGIMFMNERHKMFTNDRIPLLIPHIQFCRTCKIEIKNCTRQLCGRVGKGIKAFISTTKTHQHNF